MGRSWRRARTTAPRMGIPSVNRAQTRATGERSRSAILVATNEAPQAVTAATALRRFTAWGVFPLGFFIEGGLHDDTDPATQENPARQLAFAPAARPPGLPGRVQRRSRARSRGGAARPHHPRRRSGRRAGAPDRAPLRPG